MHSQSQEAMEADGERSWRCVVASCYVGRGRCRSMWAALPRTVVVIGQGAQHALAGVCRCAARPARSVGGLVG